MMAKYTSRLTAPTADNKYFINYSKGGYNTAIVMDNVTGSVLPNCVGYAQGRYREICGDQKVWSAVGNNLAGNAETFFNAAKKAGLPTGQTPKLGAIIVWEGKGSAAGHVAIVEEIKSNGDIVTSNSAYQGTRFYTQTVTKASGYLYNTDGSRPLLGFVYQTIEFESSTPSASTTGSITAGKKVTLNNTKCYSSESAKEPYGTKSGTYYLWDAVVKNGRIRITNSLSRVGVAGQVTCWINISDVGLTASTSASSTASTIKAGTAYTLNDTPVYASESGASIGKRSGIYRTWDSTIKNGRIRMTNSASRVGVAGQVSFWVDVCNLK